MAAWCPWYPGTPPPLPGPVGYPDPSKLAYCKPLSDMIGAEGECECCDADEELFGSYLYQIYVSMAYVLDAV